MSIPVLIPLVTNTPLLVLENSVFIVDSTCPRTARDVPGESNREVRRERMPYLETL